MTSPQSPAAQPPSFVTAALASLARHFLTIFSGWLIAQGLLDKDQGAQIVTIGIAIVGIVAGIGWSWIEKHTKIGAMTAMAAQLNPPAP